MRTEQAENVIRAHSAGHKFQVDSNENTKLKFVILQINPIFTSYNYTVTEATPSQRATETVVDNALCWTNMPHDPLTQNPLRYYYCNGETEHITSFNASCINILIKNIGSNCINK